MPTTSRPDESSETKVRHDLRVFRALRRIIRGVDLHSRRLQSEHHVTGPQLVCLLSISEAPEITPSALAREVHLSPSTVNGILDRLAAKGLIARRRASRDRRLVRVSLSAEGKAVVARAPSPLQATLADGMNALPEEDLATIADSLDRIVELMEVRRLDAAPMLAAGPIDQGEGAATDATAEPPTHQASLEAPREKRVEGKEEA